VQLGDRTYSNLAKNAARSGSERLTPGRPTTLCGERLAMATLKPAGTVPKSAIVLDDVRKQVIDGRLVWKIYGEMAVVDGNKAVRRRRLACQLR
jgi:hypothetical protein